MGKVWEKIKEIWKIKDLRDKILFILVMLILFRVAAHIPVPGVDVSRLKTFFSSNDLLGLLNVFSGGALDNFSLVAMGVGPYITASIVMQLLGMVIPALEALQKEGEAGYRKINQYTRYLTIPFALLQSYGFLAILQRSGSVGGRNASGITGAIVGHLSVLETASIMVTMTAGTVLLMWIGELITERKLGNGVSLIIFAGIVAGFPIAIQRTLAVFDPAQIFNALIFLVIGVVTIGSVVVITEGVRKVPVSYARRIRGNRVFGGVDTYLPLRVNQAGVIPIIFAISIVLIPPVAAQFLATSKFTALANAAAAVRDLFSNQIFYGSAYFVLVVAFTYFYTAVIFHPDTISENLQKQGGFVPGIRPGRPTAEFLGQTTNKIILAGALFLGAIAVLPYITQLLTNTRNLAIGGTSLLIVVSVVLETVRQLEAQLVMRDYEGF